MNKRKSDIKLLKEEGWEIISYAGADSFIQKNFKSKFHEITKILSKFQIPFREIMAEGGGKHPVNKRFSSLLLDVMDKEIIFQSKIITTLKDTKEEGRKVGSVDEAPSHPIDFFYEGENSNLGLEIEWNSKVLAYERDIMNFRRLFLNRAIGASIIITRGESLDKKLLPLAKRFFKKRVNKKNWESCIAPIKKELSNYKDANDTALKFKTFTPTQVQQIDKSIHSGTLPHIAIAENYVQNKWKGQTSHIDSLVERINRGGFQGIPFLLIGIPGKVIKGS